MWKMLNHSSRTFLVTQCQGPPLTLKKTHGLKRHKRIEEKQKTDKVIRKRAYLAQKVI